jgi:hypothetical protein
MFATVQNPITPLIPANAGTQIQAPSLAVIAHNNINAEPYDLGPGIRRDEREGKK